MTTDLYNLLSHNGMLRIGVDGSAYQRYGREGTIMWEDAIRNGISFMIWRMTRGGYYIDPTCVPNLARSAELGLPFRGVYVVITADDSLASHMKVIEQIWRQIENMFGNDPKPRIFIDDEIYGKKIEREISYGFKGRKKKIEIVYKKWKPEKINQIHEQVANELYNLQGEEESGYYSYPSFITDRKGTLSQRRHVTTKHVGLRWLAYYYRDWEKAINEVALPERIIPPEWYDPLRPDNGIDIWQFGSEANHNNLGQVLGADSQHFDINKTHLTMDELDILFNVGGSPPPSKFDPAKLKAEIRANRDEINKLSKRLPK